MLQLTLPQMFGFIMLCMVIVLYSERVVLSVSLSQIWHYYLLLGDGFVTPLRSKTNAENSCYAKDASEDYNNV